MKLELLPSLRFEYLKYYFPFWMYEEEEQVILDNLQTVPIAEWKGPVSYTHLDVYKRQDLVLKCQEKDIELQAEEMEEKFPHVNACLLYTSRCV